METRRVKGYDYLRGICSLAIMTFHIIHWCGMEKAIFNELLWDKMAIYSVILFYIISGSSLYISYHSRLSINNESVRVYLLKRACKIYPLFFIVTIFFSILHKPSFTTILLNLTGIFGFLRWNEGIAENTWSLGNEIVFYSLFPFILSAFKVSTKLYVIMISITLAIYLYFIYYIFLPYGSPADQWYYYVHPLSHLFEFIIGMILGKIYFKTTLSTKASVLYCITALILFLLYVPPNKASIIYGNHRIFFLGLCSIICLGIAQIRLPSILDHILAGLGEMSYSIYLLHPPVFLIIQKLFKILNIDAPLITIILSFISTFIASYLSYQYIEKALNNFLQGLFIRYKIKREA